MPVRVQRKRTKGFRMPPNTIYVGRPSIWANPFPVKQPDLIGGQIVSKNRKQAVINFKKYIHSKSVYRKFNLRSFNKLVRFYLKNKNLSCWCPLDEPCHADILLEIANKK